MQLAQSLSYHMMKVVGGEVVWSQESPLSGVEERPQTSFYWLGCRKHSAL